MVKEVVSVRCNSRYKWYLSGWLSQAQNFCNTKNEKSKQVQKQVMKVTPFTLQGIYLALADWRKTRIWFSCSNCHQKLPCSQNLTILRLFASPSSLVLPRSQAVQIQNFTLPEEVHTSISHHLVPAHQYIHISFHQDSALIFYYVKILPVWLCCAYLHL